MGTKLEAERKAHERTRRQLNAVRLNFDVMLRAWERETAELVEARVALDRRAVEVAHLHAVLHEHAARLEAIEIAHEAECEALRDQIALLARAAGGGAVL